MLSSADWCLHKILVPETMYPDYIFRAIKDISEFSRGNNLTQSELTFTLDLCHARVLYSVFKLINHIEGYVYFQQ